MVDLLDLVLDKRELSGVSRPFARRVLTRYLDENPGVQEKFSADPERFERSREFQRLRSAVRAELRTVYGVFFTAKYASKREPLARRLAEDPSTENAVELLALHRSSKERLPYYEFLYEQLFGIVGGVRSVLDLGCGFNPFSFPFMPGVEEYHAADIACGDLSLIGSFFEAVGVEHSEHCIDLSDAAAVAALPRADVAFAFKLFDSLEEIRRDVTADLLRAIPARVLIASFPTMSIGQRKALPNREWFERLVTGKVISRVTLPNEQFLIITLEEHEGVTRARQ